VGNCVESFRRLALGATLTVGVAPRTEEVSSISLPIMLGETLGEGDQLFLCLVTIGVELGTTLTVGEVVKRSLVMSLVAVLKEILTVGDDVESFLFIIIIRVETRATLNGVGVVES